jgi:superfamily II DNA or RNA helicase
MSATITLRDYQTAAKRAVVEKWMTGDRRTLITLPTGAGKTVVFGSLVAQANGSNKRALVLAHTEELVDQAARTLRTLLPGVDVGVVRAHHDQHDAQVIVATVQTLRSRRRLERIGRFGLIVVDEAHHAIAKTYRDIMEHFGAFDANRKLPLVLGVTATADRGDGKGLSEVFESIAYEIGIFDLIQRGYLSDIRAKRVLLDAGAPEHIAAAIRDHAPGRKSIVFLPTVEMAEQTAAAINAIGLRARSVSGQTPKAQRQQIIEDIRAGRLQCVTNCMVLTEGFDAPLLDCAVMARPTSSRALYQQSAGRVLRPFIGKTDALILDVVGVTTRHKIHTAASLIDAIPDSEQIGEGETATEAVARIQEEEQAVERQDGCLVAFDVDLFHRSNLNWIPTGNGMFILTGANQAFAVRVGASDESCDLFRLEKAGYDYRAVWIADDITLEMAQGMAEDEARRSGFDATAMRHQVWRSNQASDAQRRKLWAMGVRSRRVLDSLRSSDEASDIIAELMAVQAIERFDQRDPQEEVA